MGLLIGWEWNRLTLPRPSPDARRVRRLARPVPVRVGYTLRRRVSWIDVMGQRLGVGVIGLGRQWRRRYAPALRALAESFEVVAVCDQIPQVAAAEAARLGCPAAAGPSELIERDDVRGVLLLDLGWQRLWPMERAARAGKPVFCLPSLEDDSDNADALARRVHDARL